MTSGVYCFEDRRGKKYIGSSWTMGRRKSEHIRNLRNNSHHNRRLQGAWNKYGPECFAYSVIELCEKDILREREQFWIDSLVPWFNLTYSASAPMEGRKHTLEARLKMSQAVRPRLTPEQCAERSERLSGVPRPFMAGNSLFGGHKHSEESRRKMVESRTGKKRGPYKQRAEA